MGTSHPYFNSVEASAPPPEPHLPITCGLLGSCALTAQPLNKLTVDGLILSGLPDHVALKGGTGHCVCPALRLTRVDRQRLTHCEAVLST